MSVTKMVDASTGGHLAQAPGRISGKTGEGESTSSELPSSTRHQRQHQLRRSLLQVLQASLRNSLRRAESAERALQSSRDQLHELRDRQAARPPVEPDLHACSVQQGLDPTAPQVTQPVTRRPVFTQTGQDRKQPPLAQSALRAGSQGCSVVSFPHRRRTPSADRGDQGRPAGGER